MSVFDRIFCMLFVSAGAYYLFYNNYPSAAIWFAAFQIVLVDMIVSAIKEKK